VIPQPQWVELPIVPTWRIVFDSLRHDLRSILQVLSALVQLAVESPAHSAKSIERIHRLRATEWTARKVEFVKHMECFEVQMSPKVLFQSEPLHACNPETKEWLAEVLDTQWREGLQVGHLVVGMVAALNGVDKTLQALLSKTELQRENPDSLLPPSPTSPFEESFRALHENVEFIDTVIQSIPHVLVLYEKPEESIRGVGHLHLGESEL
jgi:hypothetical protein